MNRYVVIDVETTGNAPKRGDQIIQFGAAVIENDQIIDLYSSFVQPQQKIPPFIQQLTGISDEDVKDAPPFAEVAPQLLQRLEGAAFIAHNVPFDLGFINAELTQAGYKPFQGPVIDTVECARMLLPNSSSYKLGQLAERYGLSHDRPHQADSDAYVTAKLWLTLKKKLQRLPSVTLKRLLPLVSRMESDIELPVRESLNIVQMKEHVDENTDWDVYRGLAFKKITVLPETENEEHIQNEQVKDIFHPQSDFAHILDGYEYREGQQEMAERIQHAFDNREHLLIEAGTGTGKTLAYLVPALIHARKTGKPVILSTHTITLQNQMFDQELPILEKLFSTKVKTALLKGRNHYLCLQKFERLLNQTPEHYEMVLGLAQLLVWITETETGDVEELNLVGGTSSSFWNLVKSDEYSCIDPESPWFSRCYYQRARTRAKSAELIVTNHALLLRDLKHDHGLIPSYRHIVIDEAHHLEHIAGKQLGIDSNYPRFLQKLNRLVGKERISFLEKLSSQQQEGWFAKKEETWSTLQFEINELFRMLSGICRQRAGQKRSEVGRLSERYVPSSETEPVWGYIREAAIRITSYLDNELGELRAVLATIDMDEDEHYYELYSLLSEIENEGKKLQSLLLEEDPDYVYWMEADSRGAEHDVYLYARPVHISQLLADQLFAEKDSVVMTSGTLTVKGSFSFVEERFGLKDFAPATLIIPSPYDFKQQARLMVPSDMVSVKKETEQEFIAQTAEFIYHAASVTEGRMLVLFTSFHMLKKTYGMLRDWDDEGDFVLIGQGMKSGSRSKLMKTFKQHDRSILLGTSTFWEGVDIPGEDLSCLVIVRLPFSPPNDPVLQAKGEQMKEQGLHPFTHLSLPEAILRFKQGFGRLIRSRKDRGVAIVLDQRLLESSYGEKFVDSMPPVPISHTPTIQVLNELDDFLNQ